jgi:hypothetical protein
MTNQNLPPLQIHVHNSFILENGEGTSEGTLIGIRSLMNQAFQFTVLMTDGALFTGLPINALTRKKDNKTILPIQEAQAYDCIGSRIEVITFDLLRYMKCKLKTFFNIFYDCQYLFTIDFIDENGLARHPVQWKQFHVLENSDGNLMCYPQYRIQFKDGAFCHESNKELKNYKYNETIHLAEI